MGATTRAAARVAVLAGPAVVGFASGGYFDRGRLWAGLLACLLVLLAAVASPQPLPASAPGRLALGAMALLAAWTGISLLWAPMGGPAAVDLERLLLYTAALTAAAAWLRGDATAAAVEPALAVGTVAVVGYGLSERVAPWLVELQRSPAAGGRLSQPLTYW